MFDFLALSPIELIWVVVSTVLFVLLLSLYLLTLSLRELEMTRLANIVNIAYMMMCLLVVATLAGAWITLIIGIQRDEKLPMLIQRLSLVLLGFTAILVVWGIVISGWRLIKRRVQAGRNTNGASITDSAAADAKTRLESATDANPKAVAGAVEQLRSVLIVDDDPHVVHLLESILQKAGYVVQTATDGKEALNMVLTTTPDVVLADLIMPETDGFGFIEQLRFLPETAALPIIVVTAKMLKLDEQRWLSERAAAILQKDNLKSDRVLQSIELALQPV